VESVIGALVPLAIGGLLLDLHRDGKTSSAASTTPTVGLTSSTAARTVPPTPPAPPTRFDPKPTRGPATVSSFSLSSHQANVHGAVPFRYRVSHADPQDRIVLQKRVGTAQAWTTVKELSPTSESNTLAPAHSGKATYRVAVVDGVSGGVTANSTPQTVDVFGAVPFSDFTSGASSNTVRIGSTIFRYYDREVANNAFKISGKHCRSADLHVGFLAGDVPGTEAARVTVVSETASPLRVTVPNNTIGKISGRIGGDIEIYAPNLEIGGFSDDSIFINGVLYCSSASPE
jgi:hypothetical protein